MPNTKSLNPITTHDLLIGCIPLIVLYVIQGFSILGLAVSGLIGLSLYVMFFHFLVPKFWKRPITIISLLLMGGAMALTTSIIGNILYLYSLPIESPVAYVALVSLSGMDAPSLLVPASVLLYRVAQQILNAAINRLSHTKKTDAGIDA